MPFELKEVPFNESWPRDVRGENTFRSTCDPSPVPLGVRKETFGVGNHTGFHQANDFSGFGLFLGGKGTHIVDGHPWAVTRGDVYLLRTGSYHGFRDYENIEAVTIYFQAPIFTRAEARAFRNGKVFGGLFEYPARKSSDAATQRWHLSPERASFVQQEIVSIGEALARADEVGPHIARSRFVCLFATLADWFAETERPNSMLIEDTAASLADIIRYCDQNYTSRISVPDLAAKMFLSPDHFARLFAREVRQTPAAYIRHLRLDRAQVLMRTTQLSVASIGRQIGYEGPTQFTRAFRSEFGMPPLAYRVGYRSQGQRRQ